jgi:hypothetical protein
MKLDPAVRLEYDVITAMRGPDSTALNERVGQAKALTTAVIRSLAGMLPGNDAGAIIHTPIEARNLWAKMTADEKREVNALLSHEFHFERHFRRGLTALGKLGVPLAFEYANFYDADIRGFALRGNYTRPGRFIALDGSPAPDSGLLP